MSVKKTLPLNNTTTAVVKANNDPVTAKRRRFGRCFSAMQIHIQPGKSLKDLDSNKFKAEIKRWAKAVVAYARQVSDRFGAPEEVVIHLGTLVIRHRALARNSLFLYIFNPNSVVFGLINEKGKVKSGSFRLNLIQRKETP
ncbi:hypothetical protein GH714_035950 [Hevea brasiliensis]|uniref:Uncharacterized protein n=1 Tax=Hevea brasiliensis TaxID=3981 RepID=A0A6A6NEH0_HEVBR|nr:hypothetical protein GH714_035950 [Hevea brasiliensis]